MSYSKSDRERYSKTSVFMYLKGVDSRTIAAHIRGMQKKEGKNPTIDASTVLRYVRNAGHKTRTRWNQVKVIDGKKECRTCHQWKPLDAKNFYPRSGYPGKFLSNCIKCDKNRAVESGRRKRKMIYDKAFRFESEIARNNVYARNLLREAVEFIRMLRGEVDIVDRIELFFISEKNSLKIAQVV